MSVYRVLAIAVVFSILFFFSVALLRAAEGDLIGAISAGGTLTDLGRAVASYPDGSCVVTGYFQGAADFGAGEANFTTLTSAGSDDIVVARYNADGTLAWAKRAGGSDYDQGSGIASRADGSCVVTGYFQGAATFGAGEANATTLTSAGSDDIFVARYNADGALAWAKKAGGLSSDAVYGIASRADGSCVVTGYFNGTADFGAGEANFTALTSAGSDDIVVARYNADGTLAWAKRAGGSDYDQGSGIASHADGSCVVTGYFGGAADFGAGEANFTTLSSAGDEDTFVARYNADGTLAWAKRAGGPGGDKGFGVASCADVSCVVTGYFEEAATFGQGEANATTLTTAGSDDIFVAHYNTDGTLAWAKRAGGSSNDWGYGIASCADGSCVVTGSFGGAATFGQGEANATTLTTAGGYDIFVACYNAGGTLAWAKSAGGSSNDSGEGIASYADGSCVVTGYFRQTAVFGQGEPDETTLNSAGSYDVFVAKYYGPVWSLPAGASSISGVLFDSYVLIANPGEQTAGVGVLFLGSSGEILEVDPMPQVGPKSRRTIKISDFVSQTHPDAGAVSTIVSSFNGVPVLCERAMYWPGGTGWTNWTGGHDTIGIRDPAREVNLPEGATHIFDEYIHVLNPSTTSTASVTATFMNQFGDTWVSSSNIAPLSNWTIHVNSVADGEGQVSTRLTSDVPVAVDRTMYWPKGGSSAWRGGHCSRGISQPSTVWYLAEGANHLFDHYVLVSNPSATQTAQVKFTFMDKNGVTTTLDTPLGPESRYTVKVNDIPGWEARDQISTTVETTNAVPIFAERAMYWPKGGSSVWRGGHNSIGSPAAAARWYLPEGANHIFDHYVLAANPSASQSANVKFTFMDQYGNIATHTRLLGPRSRYTVKVNNISGWGTKDQVSTVVESINAVPVIAERSMYWPRDAAAGDWIGGHATVGIAE